MSKKKKRLQTASSTGNQLEQALLRYQPLLSQEEFAKLQIEVRQPLASTIRINLLKHNPIVLLKKLQQLYGWELEPIPFCPSGFRVKPGHQSISNTIEHRMGDFYIQEAASMLPVELFEINKDQHPLVLDMAASPGGKTIHLADRLNDQSLIIANDSSQSRIPALQVILEKWGVINQAVTCMPGELFGERLPETFDLVLLDAPCSMEGLRTSSSHPMREISEKERQRLVQRQQKLLESALMTAKIGGQIIYATCTLAPEEDESVLAALLDKYPDVFTIDNMQQKLSFVAAGLHSYKQINYPNEISHSIRLWPHVCHTAGFFAARLTKRNPIQSQRKLKTPYSKKFVFTPIPDREMKFICQQFREDYGFDLNKIIEDQGVCLWKNKDELRLLPNQFPHVFSGLQLVSSGMRLGKLSESGFFPTHEFVARFGIHFQTGIILLPDELLPNWLRGEDLRGFTTDKFNKGKVVVVTDRYGRNLGRGKVQTGQLKNLLPNRLF